MRNLLSVAADMRGLFPPGPLAWGGALVFAALHVWHVLGQYGARLGSVRVPEIDGWWLVAAGAVLVLAAPPVRRPTPGFKGSLARLIPLTLLTWALAAYSDNLGQTASTMTASLRRASRPQGRVERTFVLPTLSIEARKHLNRIAGRRRNVRLDASGYLLVPRKGSYRIETSCDDRCILWIDGRPVLDSARSGTAEVRLDQGRRRLKLQYVQTGGPASFEIRWNRPAGLELFPLEHYVASRSDDLSAGRLLWKQLQAYLLIFLVVPGAGLTAAVLITIGVHLRRFVSSTLVAPSLDVIRSERERAPPVQRPSGRGSLLVVFLLAVGVRIAFVLLSDRPLLYSHQYNYFTNALRIVEHPHSLDYILTSDDWHDWLGWTIAPLYYLFAAGVFQIAGPHLLSLRFVHCVLDAGVALAVASLGRRVAGDRGVWAGVAYALCWPAIEMTNYAMTENLHTFLLVTSLAVLAKEVERPRLILGFAGGFLLGLSALTRAVSFAFLGLVPIWRASVHGWSFGQLTRHWLVGAAILAGGAAAILPWTARNVFIVGEPVPIESVSFANLFEDMWVGSRESMEERAETIGRLSGTSRRREEVVEMAVRNVRNRPLELLSKVSTNFWHFLRPEGLHYAFLVEEPLPRWQHAMAILLEDLPFLLSLPLFLAFAVAGRRSASRRLVLWWSIYYLTLLLIVFHVEVRYRSAFLPFLFVGAAGGVSTLVERRRATLAWSAFVSGSALCVVTVLPLARPAWQTARAWIALRPAETAIDRGALDTAERILAGAVAAHPDSARPWFRFGHWLARNRHPGRASAAYRRGEELAVRNWIPTVTLPQLLEEAGQPDGGRRATKAADALSWLVDPWIMLEIAWRELPPPITDEILLARGDYGAVRGFLHPRGEHLSKLERSTWWFRKTVHGRAPPGLHRWSRGTAWLRLVPTQEAETYRIDVAMGSPFPSPNAAPTVRVSINGGVETEFELGPRIATYTVTARVHRGDPIVVRLDAPTWSRAGEPADQGVRVDRVRVAAVGASSAHRLVKR